MRLFLKSSRGGDILRFVAVLTLDVFTAEAWVACNKKNSSGGVSGQTLYVIHCTACHNPDPTRDGSLGPAIKGSSLELIRARVLRGEYPEGYAPKRSTHIMMKLPMTEEDVKALHVFLNSP